jgi:outer membrane receptor protein involved in Fe transport
LLGFVDMANKRTKNKIDGEKQMRRSYRLLTSACTLALATGAFCTPGLAQTGSTPTSSKSAKTYEDTLETITVTATKGKAEVLQKVPMAVQVFGGEQLKDMHIESIGDLVTSIPGLVEGQRQSAASSSYNIRGAGGSNANGDSPVGYYLDDVPFIVTNFGVAPPVRFFDINRVEVLRGPQGTLYGQGSSGGVFVFHTRDPNLESFEYMGEAVGSQTNGSGSFNYELSGAVSLPVIDDKLGVRVSGGLSYNPGWADAYYGDYDGTPDKKNVNSVKNNDIRVVALYKPLQNLSIKAQYWRFSPRQQYTGFLASVDPAFYEDTAGQPSYADGSFELMSATAVLDLPNFTITSATSRTTGKFGIYIPIAPAGFFSSEFYPSMLAEEIRANSTGDGPLHWVVGGQYQDGQGPQANVLSIGAPPYVYVNADNNTLTKNYAIFGEVSYDLFGGKLVPLVGLREYYDDRSFADAASTQSIGTNVLTYRATLNWLPTDTLTVFATTSTGFRAGIVQSAAQVASLQLNGIPAKVVLDPEYSTNYEIGLRWSTDDRSLSANLNFYLSKFSGMQTSVTGGVDGVDGFANFGKGTSKGIDYELNWRTPLQGLILSFVGNINGQTFGAIDPNIAAVLPANSPLKEGGRLVNSVLYNYRIAASYDTEITGDVTGYGNISYARTGNRFVAPNADTGLSSADPYFGINLMLGIRYDRYDVSLFGTNLTDERGPTIGTSLSTINTRGGAVITPRTIGLRLRINSQ